MSRNPNYNQVITLYHKETDGTWDRSVFYDCFWKDTITETQGGTEVRLVNTYTVRIPMEAVSNSLSVSLDDIVIKGYCADVLNRGGMSSTELLRKYKPRAFKVTAFADNTSHVMDRHYRLGG